jgi:hypothetical protein
MYLMRLHRHQSCLSSLLILTYTPRARQEPRSKQLHGTMTYTPRARQEPRSKQLHD